MPTYSGLAPHEMRDSTRHRPKCRISTGTPSGIWDVQPYVPHPVAALSGPQLSQSAGPSLPTRLCAYKETVHARPHTLYLSVSVCEFTTIDRALKQEAAWENTDDNLCGMACFGVVLGMCDVYCISVAS